MSEYDIAAIVRGIEADAPPPSEDGGPFITVTNDGYRGFEWEYGGATVFAVYLRDGAWHLHIWTDDGSLYGPWDCASGDTVVKEVQRLIGEREKKS